MGEPRPAADSHEAERQRVKVELAKTAEVMRKKREARARLDLALSVGIGMWDWNIETDVLTWDERMCDLFGVSVESPKAYATFADSVAPEDRDRVQAAINASVDDGVPYEIDYWIVLPSGERRLIHARGTRYPEPPDAPEKLIGVCMPSPYRSRESKRQR